MVNQDDNRQSDNLEGESNATIESTAESVQESEETVKDPGAQDLQETDQATTERGSGARNDEEYGRYNPNWRALRERTERAERERDELASKIRQEQAVKEVEVFSDDDLVEHKHFKKYKKEYEREISELKATVIETKIKAVYPDFDSIVTPETIARLRNEDQELADSLASNKNLYSQASATYKAIKRLGIIKPTYDIEKKAVSKNLSKPRPLSSVTPTHNESPLARANAFATGLTDEMKKEIYAESLQIIKNG